MTFSTLFPVSPLLVQLLIVLLGPLCGLLLGKIAAEEISAAKKYLAPLLWALGIGAVIFLGLFFYNSRFAPVLAVDLFLAGVVSGAWYYDHLKNT